MSSFQAKKLDRFDRTSTAANAQKKSGSPPRFGMTDTRGNLDCGYKCSYIEPWNLPGTIRSANGCWPNAESIFSEWLLSCLTVVLCSPSLHDVVMKNVF